MVHEYITVYKAGQSFVIFHRNLDQQTCQSQLSIDRIYRDYCCICIDDKWEIIADWGTEEVLCKIRDYYVDKMQGKEGSCSFVNASTGRIQQMGKVSYSFGLSNGDETREDSSQHQMGSITERKRKRFTRVPRY